MKHSEPSGFSSLLLGWVKIVDPRSLILAAFNLASKLGTLSERFTTSGNSKPISIKNNPN